MLHSLVYMTFGDTFRPENESSYSAAVKCVHQQLMAAAERIKTDPAAINDYLRVDSAVNTQVVEVEAQSEPQPDVQLAPQPDVQLAPQPATAKPTVHSEEEIKNIIFQHLKCTQKSQKIIGAFVQNPGTELTIQDLQELTGYRYSDISAWLNSTGKRLNCIDHSSRGKYRFNPDHI